MIEQLSSGMYRVRYRYGHDRRYNALKKLKKPTSAQKKEMSKLEKDWGLPEVIKTRRSLNCIHEWQAKQIEKFFKMASDFEADGKKVPKNLLNIDVAPEKVEYLEELGYFMASICGFREELIGNLEYDTFLDQSDANLDWIDNMAITKSDIELYAYKHCSPDKIIDLKDKTIIFTGAVTGFTGDEEYLKCLRTMAKSLSVDAIITVGSWIKTIFLHKSAQTPTILPALKDLIKDVRILAIRSNRDRPEHLQKLKELGIEFINGIEDDRHVFTGLSFTRTSSQDQLSKYENTFPGKNVFTYTSYVGIKSQATKGGGLRYLVGSGSSGHNTPSARVWANSYDGQLLNSETRDSIGGHLLRFDSEGNLFPTTFRYQSELNAIFYGGDVYFKSKKQAGKLHLIISDFHACSHHKYALTALLDFIDKNRHRIKTFIINGDFLDNLVLCHHNRGKILTQVELAKKDMDLLKELAYTQACIKIILSHLDKKTHLIFKLGNHEVNSIQKFLERDINHFLQSMLNIDKLLGLKDLGFEIIDAQKSYAIYDVTLQHGHEMYRTSARKIFGKNFTRGHSHTLMIDAYGVSLAGMKDPSKATYLSHPYTDWAVGFAAITEYNSRTVLPQPILLNKKSYFDLSKVVTFTKCVDIPLPDNFAIKYDIEWTGREDL